MPPERKAVKKLIIMRKRHGNWKKSILGIVSQINLDCSSMRKSDTRRATTKKRTFFISTFFDFLIKDNPKINKIVKMMCSFPTLKDIPSEHPEADPAKPHGLFHNCIGQ